MNHTLFVNIVRNNILLKKVATDDPLVVRIINKISLAKITKVRNLVRKCRIVKVQISTEYFK